MRTKNSLKNMIASMVSNILTIIIGIVAQAIFIKILGSEYLGLNSLFNNVISMLAIAELGIGSAIVYNLYKPIAENNIEQIKSLMQFYKKNYQVIGIVVAIIGLMLIPFLKYIVNIETITININVYFVYLLFLLDTVFSYFLSYKRSLLYATQQNSIISIIHIGYVLILNLLQLIILFFTKNYYLYLLTRMVTRILENLVITYIANKNYPYLKDKNVKKLNKSLEKDIYTKIKALFFHKIGAFVVLGSDNIIISKEYDSNNNVTKTMFSNNNQIEYNYDKFGRVESINKSGKQYNYYYDNMGALAKVETANEVYDYNYNLLQKLYKFIYNNEFISKYTYDLNGNLNHRKVLMDNKEYDIEYLYNKDDNPTKITIENNNINIEYDDLGRIIKQDINGNIPLEITYMSNGENTSLNIETVKINNKLFKFKYDDCYNITEIYINENIVKKYKYDDINELILEIDYNLNQKIKYRYDKNGNILSKMICSLDDVLISQDNFEYNNINWKDQLTKFNDEEITYDNLGNPLSFGNKTYTWINGTQLKSFSDNEKTIDYEYNHLGQMISKKIGNTITKYYYESSLLTLEKRNNNVIYFIYNSDEKLVGFKYNDELYYYQMNHLNDITGIYDSNYNLVVSYSYDSWGNILSITDSLGNEVTDPSHIGVINPFRFRSYYYDEDIKMYCFQERYYNPSICRFFNIDSQIGNDFLGSNLYVYCGNNPINRSDDEGKGFLSAFIAGMAIGAAIKITSNIIRKKPFYDGLGGAIIEGGVSAALATTRLGLLGSSLLVSSVKNIGKESYKYGTGKTKVTKKNVISSTSTIVVNAVTDTGLSAMGGALSYKVARSLGIVDVGRPAKKFMVQLLGKKAMKNYFKDIISAAYSETVNSLLDYNHNIVQSKVTDLF